MAVEGGWEAGRGAEGMEVVVAAAPARTCECERDDGEGMRTEVSQNTCADRGDARALRLTSSSTCRTVGMACTPRSIIACIRACSRPPRPERRGGGRQRRGRAEPSTPAPAPFRGVAARGRPWRFGSRRPLRSSLLPSSSSSRLRPSRRASSRNRPCRLALPVTDVGALVHRTGHDLAARSRWPGARGRWMPKAEACLFTAAQR